MNIMTLPIITLAAVGTLFLVTFTSVPPETINSQILIYVGIMFYGLAILIFVLTERADHEEWLKNHEQR